MSKPRHWSNPTKEERAHIAYVMNMPEPRDVCARCRACHPGRQFGGDRFCHVPDCRCHNNARRTG